MAISLREAGLEIDEEVAIPVWYHGENIGTFRADIIVAGAIILGLKAGEEINKAFEAQLLIYLRSSRIQLGSVSVFVERAKFRRIVMKTSANAG